MTKLRPGKLGAVAVTEGGEDDRYVFSASLWEGKAGALLHMLGLSPTDRENRKLDQAAIEQIYRKGREALSRRLNIANDGIAEQTNGKKLAPFALISDTIWNGPEGDVMLALGLSPYDEWNIALLPTDFATAQLLDLPLHPRREVAGLVEMAREALARVIAELRDLHDRTARDQDFAAYDRGRHLLKEKIKRLAAHMQEQMLAVTRRHLG